MKVASTFKLYIHIYIVIFIKLVKLIKICPFYAETSSQYNNNNNNKHTVVLDGVNT
jgi:hypothetical protein